MVSRGMRGRWKLEAGYYVASKGHLRYSAGPHKGKYVHRVVMAQAAREWCYYPVNPNTGLPDGWDVHHLDGCQRHNCLGNLLLVPHDFHGILTRAEGRWRMKWLIESGALNNPEV